MNESRIKSARNNENNGKHKTVRETKQHRPVGTKKSTLQPPSPISMPLHWDPATPCPALWEISPDWELRTQAKQCARRQQQQREEDHFDKVQITPEKRIVGTVKMLQGSRNPTTMDTQRIDQFWRTVLQKKASKAVSSLNLHAYGRARHVQNLRDATCTG